MRLDVADDDCMRLAVPNKFASQSLSVHLYVSCALSSPVLPSEPFLVQGGAAARRRWPGVSAGFSLGEARPADAGPTFVQAGRSTRLIRQTARLPAI